ncbi:MAG: energy transducer TonB, partial [Bryobacteraceae bacterium]
LTEPAIPARRLARSTPPPLPASTRSSRPATPVAVGAAAEPAKPQPVQEQAEENTATAAAAESPTVFKPTLVIRGANILPKIGEKLVLPERSAPADSPADSQRSRSVSETTAQNRSPVLPEQQSATSANPASRTAPPASGEIGPVQPKPRTETQPPTGQPKPAPANPPRVTEEVTPVRAIQQIVPTVPRQMWNFLNRDIQVEVMVQVDERGKVVKAEAISNSHKYFAGLAVNAARGWQFQPARVGSRNVPGETKLVFHFRADTRTGQVSQD